MVSIYLKAFSITVIIFVIGIFIGIQIENFVLSGNQVDTQLIEDLVKNTELELLYFQDLDDQTFCQSFEGIVYRTNDELDKLETELLNEKDSIFRQEQIKAIKLEYTYALLKAFVLNNKIKERCDSENLIILYFYSTENCLDCVIQGNILTDIKNQYKDKVLVFPFDKDMNIFLLKTLISSYNIKTYPSIAIGNQTFEGLTDREKVLDMLE